MRLRLSHNFRTALLAAISAVGVTLTQAWADTVSTTLTTTFANCDQSTATAVTTANAFGDSSVLTIPGATVTSLTQHTSGTTVELQTADAAGTDATFFSPNNNVGNAQAWKLTMSYTNAGDIQSITGMTLSVGLFNNQGKWQTSSANWPNGNETFTVTVTANGVSKTYTGNLFTTDDHHGKGSDKFAVTLTGDELDLSKADSFTVTIDLPNNTMGSGCFMGLQNVGFNVMAESTPVTATEYWWYPGSTTGTNWNTASTCWVKDNQSSTNRIAFVDGALSNVTFNDKARSERRTVTLAMDPTVGTMTVENANYTLNLSSHTLTATNLAVKENATLSFSGNGEVAVSGNVNIQDANSLVVGENATLKVANAATAKQLMMGEQVTNNGTFAVSGNVNLADGESTQMSGTLAIQNATVTMGTGEGTTASIASFNQVILDGGQITIDEASAVINGVTVENGKTGTIKVEDMKNLPNTASLDGVTRVDGTLNLTNHWNSSITIDRLTGAGTLDQKNDGAAQEMVLNINSLEGFTGSLSLKHDKDKDAININTGTTAVNFNALELAIGGHTAKFTLEADATIRQMTLTSGTANFTGEHTLTTGGLTGAGTLNVENDLTINSTGASEYTGALNVGGQIVKKGNGSQTLTGAVLHDSIDLQGGTLTLNGTYNLDGLTPTHETEKGYVEGEYDGNGFKDLDITFQMVNKGAGTTLNAGNATFTYKSSTSTTMDDNGQAFFAGVDRTSYYVNENGTTESLANALSHSSTLANIYLADGTALNVNADATLAGTLTVDGAATLSHTGAAENNTLQVGTLSMGDAATLTLKDGVKLELTERLVDEQHQEGLKLEEGSTLTLNLYNEWDDPTSGHNNFKNAVFLDEDSCGIVEVKQGAIAYYSELGTSVLHLDEGSELNFGDNPAGTSGKGQDHALFENNIVLDGNATVATHGTSKHIDCTISGDISGEDYTLTHTHDGNLLLDFTGTVILGGYNNQDTRSELGQQQNSRFRGETKIGTVTTAKSSSAYSHTEFCGHAEVGTIKGEGYVHLTDLTPGDDDQATLTITGTVTGTGADAFTGIFRQGAGGLIIAKGANVDFSEVDYLQENDYEEQGRKFDGYLEVKKGGTLTLGEGIILGDITTAGTLNFAKELDISADILTQTDGEIHVFSEAEVTFGEGTLTSAIQNEGSVILDTEGSMDVSALTIQGGGERKYYNIEGTETSVKSYFLGVTKGYVTVVDNSGDGSYNEGATASFYGKTYELTEDQNGDGIISFATQVFYDTYYHGVEGATMTVSDIKSGIPGTTTETLQRVVLTAGELDVNSDVPTVDSSSATVSLNDGTVTDLNVKGATTVNGTLGETTNLNIDHAQVATLTNGLTRDGVTFSNGAQITNIAHDRTTYSLDNGDARVTANSITANNSDDVAVGNQLNVPTVTNEGTGKLTLTNGDAELKNIFAIGGNIAFQNMGSDTVELDNVSIVSGKQVGVYTGSAETSASKATVSIGDTLTAGSGAAMEADVTMETGSTLDVSASGGISGLNLMQSSLTLESGVSLSAADMAAIENMTLNSNYDLAYGVSSLYLGDTPWSEPIKASEVFANFPTTGDPNTDWYVYYSGTEMGGQGGNVGAVYILKAPEPTTGTLSLLALACLAARRRRKY